MRAIEQLAHIGKCILLTCAFVGWSEGFGSTFWQTSLMSLITGSAWNPERKTQQTNLQKMCQQIHKHHLNHIPFLDSCFALKSIFCTKDFKCIYLIYYYLFFQSNIWKDSLLFIGPNEKQHGWELYKFFSSYSDPSL